MDITELLNFAKRNNASDLHLSAGNPPIVRINGDMLPMKTPAVTGEQVKQLIFAIMTDQQRAAYERDMELDFAVSFGENMRFRINAFHTIAGPAAALRDIPTRIQSLEELSAPDVLVRLASLHKGLVLVTGPTGSGKSTTLAAMVHHINMHFNRHIITVEDPVEFIHPSQRSLVNQREVGSTTRSFAQALKSALREDPDVILVGELRDLETIQLALTAAETGHLVMGTLHTNSAPKTIDRIIDVFSSSDKEMIRSMLSASLEGIVTQNLLKRADGQGRVAIHEILLGTGAVRNLVREGKIPQLYSLMQMGSRIGMQTMKDELHKRVNDGIITEDAARSALATGADDGADGEVTAKSAPKAAANQSGGSSGF